MTVFEFYCLWWKVDGVYNTLRRPGVTFVEDKEGGMQKVTLLPVGEQMDARRVGPGWKKIERVGG